ncbi:MAG: glycosyltransferase [Patescibacteria group bacterium]
MKIIIGTESFAPTVSGVAIFADRLASFLQSGGHEVYVFAPSTNRQTYWDKTKDGVPVLRLKSITDPFRHNHRVTLLPLGRVRSEVEKIKPDIIHLQDPTSISAALLKIANQKKIPVVITNHFSIDFIKSYLKMFSFLEPLVIKILTRRFVGFYNRCRIVTTPSGTARDKIKRWGFRTPIRVLSNGVDTVRFHPPKSIEEVRKKFDLPQKPIIIYSGRIDADKSVDVLVRAIPLVLKEADAHFLFVGSGEKLEAMKALALDLRVSRAATFWGWVNYNSPEFPLGYQTGAIFASPSTIETQSIVMLEAMATGLPIVAAAAGSFPEFVKDGENGYLFPPGNSAKMADYIIKIVKDDHLQQKLSRGALAVAAEHKIDLCLGRFEDLYKEVLASEKESNN